ncbi:MAG: hypothetical protein ABS980_33310, partial [Rhodococcus sp. (in: high G+C Gram-positive bacteria)]
LSANTRPDTEPYLNTAIACGRPDPDHRKLPAETDSIPIGIDLRREIRTINRKQSRSAIFENRNRSVHLELDQ